MINNWNSVFLRLLLVLLAAGCGRLVVAAAPPVAPPLESALRKLERDIAAVRGLAFKQPVKAKVIPRPKDAAKRVQGYYSTKDKTLYVYDDVAGNYERGVLVHEMVHALQDQHFGLANLHATNLGTDAELASAALIEGDATFTMIELLKKDQPRVAAMLDTRLEKARDVQGAFLYAQGARYVKALKERGGWEAVNTAYRFRPRTTAAILHPDGVKTIDLGPGKTRGELAILKLFAAQPATAALAVEAAAGWRGDRVVEQGAASAWIVAFANPDDVQQFQTAWTKLRIEAAPELKPRADAAGTKTWQDAKGGILAFSAQGNRALIFEAPDDAAYHALRERIEAPKLDVYSTKEKQFISFGTLLDRLLDADLICIGEMHESELNHHVQLQIIKGLYAADERLGVGMEMFQRPFQPVVDRYCRGEASEHTFLAATEYAQRWSYDWSLYRPIVEFCRRNGIPLAALNAPRELTGRISRVGYAKLNEQEKSQLGPIDFQLKPHRDYWFDRLGKLHGKSGVSEEQKQKSYEVMTTWDDYMAASAAAFQQARQLRRLVILAGSGHIDRGFGIPLRAAKRTGGKAATVHVEVSAEPKKAVAEPVADFIVVVQ